MSRGRRAFLDVYEGEHLNRVAFPMGGMGAGMLCLEGTGALSHASLRHEPNVFHEPCVFSALWVKDAESTARVLEGPVPGWKRFGRPGSGNGSGGTTLGLPRFDEAQFRCRFPFAYVQLREEAVPVCVGITGWSPFVPGNADDSSLPVAALEFEFSSVAWEPLDLVYSFHAVNFMATQGAGASVERGLKGFILHQSGSEKAPWDQGDFLAEVDDDQAAVDCAWFRGGWFDALTMVWKDLSDGRVVSRPPFEQGETSRGGSLYVPFRLQPGQTKRITLRFSWYVPKTNLRVGQDPETGQSDSRCGCGGEVKKDEKPTHVPWYAGRFQGIEDVGRYWRDRYESLREDSERFSQCFYDTTLPAPAVEAIAANLTILKSPTVLRQEDGRFWCWEGCCDGHGCCHGSCTHVWNYAQAICHLFPELERTLRETEFFVNQDEKGHQGFRASLPIRPLVHDFHAASDGQLGGIMKVYRDWRICGDMEWLKRMWPAVRKSLDYCIETWDPDRLGVLVEPHHNTYDIEFWGPDGMCSSFYLGALKAASRMAEAVGEKELSLEYLDLFDRGRAYLEEKLFDGEYFFQEVRWKDLRADDPEKSASDKVSSEALELLKAEGPKYQYGQGCLSDGVLGCWMAEVCGVGEILDPNKVRSHLLSVHRYNLKRDLSKHVNPQRPSFALGEEGGLLLCTYPKGGRLSLPFPYSEEVWTGFEYQVASHLMMMGQTLEGLDIVEEARKRYDGRDRNPFNEYECGHWYARALSSYGLIQGFSGVRYDAVTRTLHVRPAMPGDWKIFLCTATGYGTVECSGGEIHLRVRSGQIPVDRIERAVNVCP